MTSQESVFFFVLTLAELSYMFQWSRLSSAASVQGDFLKKDFETEPVTVVSTVRKHFMPH